MKDSPKRPHFCTRCENPIPSYMMWYNLEGVGNLCENCVDYAYHEYIDDLWRK